jgi:hypothetical protein
MTKKDEQDIIPQELAIFESLKEPMAIGEVFAKSGMFPDIKTQAQAVVKILAGKEMGLTPFEAMNNLYIVNGKIAVMSNAMASIVKKGGKYDYKVDKLDDQECTLTFSRMNGEVKELGQSTFTFKDAAKAGLANKDVWKNYPRNMLFSRALANGVRWFCPDAACGYVVEELQDVAQVKEVKTIELKADGEVTNGEA